MRQISMKFIRWGTGFLLVGLWTGYGPFHHYLYGGVETACPWAPVHAHATLLGWVGLTLFGLVYGVLPGRDEPDRLTIKLALANFWLSVTAVLGVVVNGIFGYRLLDHMSPGFFYVPDQETLRLWLTIDGLVLSLFMFGSLFFAAVVFRKARPSAARAA